MSDQIVQLKKKIIRILSRTKELRHGMQTMELLLKLKPDADWQLQVAALAHDIERAVHSINHGAGPVLMALDYETYDHYKQAHALRSADIVQYLMQELDFEASDISRVGHAISLHEVGGTADSDLVRDADSLRWFLYGLEQYKKKSGIEGACKKGWWMYVRASEGTKRSIDAIKYNARVREFIQTQMAELQRS